MNIPSLEQVNIELSRKSYVDYVEYVHDGRWIAGKANCFVCNKVQEFIEIKNSKAFDILIIQEPPQHGKSMSVTETLPSWYLGKYPQNRVIQASYNEDTAERFCRRNKEKVTAFGKKIFDIEISKKTDRSTEFELSNGVGRMISRGIMSGITSNPANLIIIDDPIKNRMEADSETFRNRLWEEWQNTLKTRLAAGAKVIVIMTRWHEDDLAGRILKNEENVTVINLPCEAEENDPLGRAVGEALFPEIGKDNEWLREFKKGYKNEEGSRAWLALFQGRPTAEEGNLIKREWWQYYTELPKMINTIISVDATFKDNSNSDYVAIEVWGKNAKDIYLIDLINERMDFTKTLESIRFIKSKHPKATAIYIEDKANGSAIISVLKRELSGIVPVEPLGGKIARVNAISATIESGSVWLPLNAPFTIPFVNQFSSFPNGENDDMVDSASQALNKLIKYSAIERKVEEKPIRNDLNSFIRKGRR